MTDEEMEADAAYIGEYTVAKLDALPGDVVVVTVSGEMRAEESFRFNTMLDEWRKSRGYLWRFLVLFGDVKVTSVIHSLDAVELEKAGSGGFPGEDRCAHGLFDPERVCRGTGLDAHVG
jgi:hypothetical protein